MRSQRTLTVNRFGGDGSTHNVQVKTADIVVRNRSGERFNLTVSVTPSIMNNLTRVALKKDVFKKLPNDIRMADDLPIANRSVAIEFLLGNDYYDDFVTGTKIDLTKGLKLVSSKFGWILTGRVSEEPHGGHATALYSQLFTAAKLDDVMVESIEQQQDVFKASQIEDLWNLEALGIKENPNPASDDSALEQFHKTVKFENGRYMVTWPWQANADDLPTNYEAAFDRLTKTVTRISRTPGLIERYDAVMKDQLEKSVIEEAPNTGTSNRVHYLPHREVLTPEKETTKLRIVYDASARAAFDKPSLNDCLYRGLVFMTPLLTLIMRFMIHPIAVISDIEKAFLQVGLQEHERDVTRFLWLRDIEKPVTTDNLVTYRFARVAFGMKPSPFLLGATIAYHLRKSTSEVAKQIERNIYTDNVITGFPTEAEATEFYWQSKKIFQDAGMNLREFATNSPKVRQEIPVKDRAAKSVTKVLGIGWNSENDEIFLNIPDVLPVANTTRDIMKGLLKVYDPIGLVSPIVIKSRILLQQICGKRSLTLKQRPEQTVVDAYNAIVEDYAEMKKLKWPRYAGHGLTDVCRLMCFCDASQDAYATVLYLQSKTATGWSSRIIFSKARVSPLKSRMTIPRLELLAVLIGVRAIRFIREQLEFSGRVILWSDSQCVLKWINSQKVMGAFVENRLKEIRKTPEVEYRFVKTEHNPADLPSRGASIGQLTNFWWKGPQWSMTDDDLWPKFLDDRSLVELGSEDPESQTTEMLDSVTCTAGDALNLQPFGISIEDISSYDKLIRITAWCERFVRITTKNANRGHGCSLSRHELKDAENHWIRYAQTAAYPDLHKAIICKKRHPVISQLGTVVDEDGVIRCKGRLGRSTTRVCPILVPRSRLADLLIDKYHRISLHAGKRATLNALRFKYWIVRGLSSMQKVLHRCVTCRKASGKGFARPAMPDLPFYRVNQQRPFQYSGLDYMGPLKVRVNREILKVWISLFTCLSTRAIHLELVGSLSADDFLMALRRFVSRRGRPQMILCDNASQFLAISRNDLLSNAIQGDPIEWRFITPLSPWKGGIYERLIGLVKSALRRCLGRAMLTKDQLVTLLAEVEYTLNSRPITALQGEPDERRALTPNDLIGVVNLGDTHDEQEDPTDVSYDETQQSVSNLYRKTRNILAHFWQIWRSEYLDQLRERQSMQHKDVKGCAQRCPVVGEVVILRDDGLPRNQWKLAVIVALHTSSDGQVRSVVVKMPGGTTLSRPLTLVCPLEVMSHLPDGIAAQHSIIPASNNDSDVHESGRPVRGAAITARSKLKLMLNDM